MYVCVWVCACVGVENLFLSICQATAGCDKCFANMSRVLFLAILFTLPLAVLYLVLFILYTCKHGLVCISHTHTRTFCSLLPSCCIVFAFNKSKNNSSVAPEESQDDICTSTTFICLRWCWRTKWWKRAERERENIEGKKS